jgi:hypothetical protein
MNIRVILLSLLFASIIFTVSFFFISSEYNNTIFTQGTGYSLFDITKLELEEPMWEERTWAPVPDSTKYIIHGSPFICYYTVEAHYVDGAYISFLPLIVDFLIIFSFCLLVVYSVYKSKYKKMLGFKKKHRNQLPDYEYMWNFIEPDYYNKGNRGRYSFDRLYMGRSKNKRK